MGNYRLQTQLFCLYFTPVITVTFLSFGFYVMLFEQLKSIVSDQEEYIYVEQQSAKKQVLLGLKSHLDQSFFLQSQESLMLSRFITKIYEGDVKLNSGFKEPMLNLERFYLNKEDSTLTALYQKSDFLVSVWVKGGELYFSDLEEEEQQLIKKAAVVDVLTRSFNLLNAQRTFKYKNHFTGFQLDGSLFANPAFNQSMNESFQNQTLCPKKQFYDSTCRIWYNVASQEKGTIMPAPFKILTTKIPYMSLSLCRRNDVHESLNSVGCLGFNIEQVAKAFSNLDIQTGSFSVLHPSSDSLIYDKSIEDYSIQYDWKKELSVNMTDNEKTFFVNSIDNILKNFKSESQIGVNLLSYNQGYYLENVKGFEFLQQGDRQYSLLIPIQIADKLNGSNDVIFPEIMILLYVFQRNELIKSFSEVVYFLGNIFMANSIVYLIMFIICLLIIMYYSQKFSQLIELPIDSLIERLNSIKDKLQLSDLRQTLHVDIKASKKRKDQHTCMELTNLEKYITNIWEVFSFNLNYSTQTEDTFALFTYIKAIKYFQKVEDFKSLGSTYNNIACLHFNSHRYLEALDCFNQSLICLEEEKQQLKNYYEEEQRKISHQQNNSFKSLFHQLETGKKQTSVLLPWIEKYIYGSENALESSIEDIENACKCAEANLESLKFDRLFGYANTILAWSLENQLKQVKDKHQTIGEKRYNCFWVILSSLIKNKSYSPSKDMSTESLDLSFSKFKEDENEVLQSKVKNSKVIIQESALLNEYFKALRKLLKITKSLDNDPNRYVIIYIEISKAFLLKNNLKLSEFYFNLAYKHFLEIFKRLKSNLFAQSRKTYGAVNFSSYMQQLNQILIKKFSSEEVNEEINFFKCSNFRQSGNTTTRQLRSPSFQSPPQAPIPAPLRKRSWQGSQVGNIPTQTNVQTTIQPILEDYMESQEEINQVLRQKRSIFNRSVSVKKTILKNVSDSNNFDDLKFSSPEKEKEGSRTHAPLICHQRTGRNSFMSSSTERNRNNTSTSMMNTRSSFVHNQNFVPFNQNQNVQQQTIGSFSTQNASNIQFFPSQLDITINTIPNSNDTSLHKVMLLTGNSMGFDDNPQVYQEEIQPFNILEQQLVALDQATSLIDQSFAFNSQQTNSNSSAKTGFSYPIDVLFTKVQIQESLIELKKGNIYKGCTILSEAFEFAPRYLPYDRLLILDLIKMILDKFDLNVQSIIKQINKFNKMRLKISVIVNCEGNYLKRVSKQLYEIYTLCDSFSLIVVNEQVEQYIAPINQGNFRGKENFISNIMKCLRFKSIRSNQQYFISALEKASNLFISPKGLPINQKLMKKYILVFGDRDCIFKDSTYRHRLFKKLAQTDVKILLFNPQDDKEGSHINLSYLELPFKIRFFNKSYQLIEYLKKKSIKCPTTKPFLVEKI